MKVIKCILIIVFVSFCQGDFGTLWNNFKEVAHLGDVVEEMEQLIKHDNKDMLELKDYLKRNEAVS